MESWQQEMEWRTKSYCPWDACPYEDSIRARDSLEPPVSLVWAQSKVLREGGGSWIRVFKGQVLENGKLSKQDKHCFIDG